MPRRARVSKLLQAVCNSYAPPPEPKQKLASFSCVMLSASHKWRAERDVHTGVGGSLILVLSGKVITAGCRNSRRQQNTKRFLKLEPMMPQQRLSSHQQPSGPRDLFRRLLMTISRPRVYIATHPQGRQNITAPFQFNSRRMYFKISFAFCKSLIVVSIGIKRERKKEEERNPQIKRDGLLFGGFRNKLARLHPKLLQPILIVGTKFSKIGQNPVGCRFVAAGSRRIPPALAQHRIPCPEVTDANFLILLPRLFAHHVTGDVTGDDRIGRRE